MDSSVIYLMFCSAVCFYMECSGLPRSIQFKRKLVGYNSALDSNIIDVSTEPSLIECGRSGLKKNCTSFLYESTNNVCTMYSVYLIGDGQIMDNYYVNIEAYVNVVGTCQSAEYSSGLTNVALHKPVTMSSVYTPNWDGTNLVNGVRIGSPPCAHTNHESNPYMMVDLTTNYNVHSLNVLNRLDCCGERLFNLKIELGETLSSMTEYVYHDGEHGDECTFVLDRVTEARYVRVSVVGNTMLTICELAVYSLG